MPGHDYTVELRFSGDTLDPLEISKRLNLQPSNTRTGLSTRSKGRVWTPMWGYNGHDLTDFQLEWPSLEQGLRFLLLRLTPLRGTLAELSTEFKGIWWCGHFQSSFDGGPTLTPSLLKELANIGIPLYIDNYFSGDASYTVKPV
jgi:hypothetical protein